MTQTTLGQRIHIMLQENELKKVEFAKALGISANYVSLLAAGKKTVMSETLAKLIENIYGYSSKWVLTGEGEKMASDLKAQTIMKIKAMNQDELNAVAGFIMGLK